MAAVNALYDMCSRPEYIDSLRKEAVAAARADNQRWQLSAIRQLKRLDSFMKESLRYNQADSRKLISVQTDNVAFGAHRIIMLTRVQLDFIEKH